MGAIRTESKASEFKASPYLNRDFRFVHPRFRLFFHREESGADTNEIIIVLYSGFWCMHS